MKKSRKFIALAIVLTMCVMLIAACGGDANDTSSTPGTQGSSPAATTPGVDITAGGAFEEAPDDEDTVFAEHIDIIADNNNIAVINPFNPAANPTSTNWVFVMVHDRLLERDHYTAQFVPGLAHSWNTDDFQTFTFELRDDVTFHNGERFTADDVVFTINHAKEHGAGSPGLAPWVTVSTATAIDDYTVELVLNDVFVDFFHAISVPAAAIVSRVAMEADPELGAQIGTGHYRVIEFVSNDYIRFERSENLWNERFNTITPYITLRFVPEMSARTIRLQRNESQLSFGTSADDLPMFQNDPDNFQVIPHMFNNVQGFSFNMSDPLLGECWHLRRAIAYAVNRPEVTLFAASEWAAPLDDTNGGGTTWGHSTDFRNGNIPSIPFDPDMARYHLEQSIYDGEVIELAAAIITNIRTVQAIQQNLAQVGINTRINEMDSPGLSAYMLNPDAGSQIVFFNLQMNYSAGSMANSFVPGLSQNRMQYNNPEVTALFEQAATEFDPEVRRDLYYRAQEIIAEDLPFVHVFWRINGVVAADGIGGLRLQPDSLQNDFRELFQVIR